ncbi:hypothetical protein Hhel01_03945 [Haloferula helveola]
MPDPVPESGTELSVSEPANTEVSASPNDEETGQPTVAAHYGFARHVPEDVSFYMSVADTQRMVDGLLDGLQRIGFIYQEEVVVGEGDDDEGEAADEESPKFGLTPEMRSYVGDEAFLFVGGEAGEQIRVISLAAQLANAELAGYWTSVVLGYLGEEEPSLDFSEFDSDVSDAVIGPMVDALEQDGRVRMPSIVFGWRPEADKLEACVAGLEKGVAAIVASEELTAEPIKFERSGVSLSGWTFADLRKVGEDMKKELEKELEENRAELLQQFHEAPIPYERMQSLIDAVSDFELTVAYGSVDGYALAYIGNGAEGFQLAESPVRSLAASDALSWSTGIGDPDVIAALYLSEAAVRSTLPLDDSSASWRAAAKELGDPLEDPETLRALFLSVADLEEKLAARDCSAWSGLILKDGGYRIESRGGKADPGLDYDAPLALTGCDFSEATFFRAHWAQSRARNELEWRETEALGLIAEIIYDEARRKWPEAIDDASHVMARRAMDEIRDLSRIYRDEFRAGIGDEIAVVADLRGPLPSWSDEVKEKAERAKIPRLAVARTVTDRSKLAGAGQATMDLAQEGIREWTGSPDFELPPPASIKSDGLTTWHYPLFEGESDFLPGISVGDRIWIAGTSRQLAADFAAPASSGAPNVPLTGLRLELDFRELWKWIADMNEEFGEEAEALAKDSAPPMGQEALETMKQADIDGVAAEFTRIERLTYGHWMEDDASRTSIHLHIRPRPEDESDR